MSTPAKSLSYHDLQLAARRLEIDTILEYTRTDGVRKQMAVNTLRSCVLSRGTPELLDRLAELSKSEGGPWQFTDPTTMVKHALLGRRPENVAWCLDFMGSRSILTEDVVRRALVDALDVTASQVQPEGPLAALLLPIVQAYPDILGVVPPGKLTNPKVIACLDLIASQTGPEGFAPFLGFFNRLPPEASRNLPHPTQAWWCHVAKTYSFDDIVVWSAALETHGDLSAAADFPLSTRVGRAPDLWSAVIDEAGVALEAMCVAPATTPAGRALRAHLVDNRFSELVFHLGGTRPARLERLLSKSAFMTQQFLTFRTPEGGNALHALAISRVRTDIATPTELRWSRLEDWVERHALSLASEKTTGGDTPLSLIDKHPAWSARVRRALLSYSLLPSPPVRPAASRL